MKEGTAAAAKTPAKAGTSGVSDPKAAPAGKVAVPQADSPGTSAPEAPPQSLERQLKLELANLRRFEAELEAIRSAPLPEKPAVQVEQPVEKPQPAPVPLPGKPAPGLEEAFADCLYGLGEYEKARAIYTQVVADEPEPDTLAWACFQIGNCARHLKDFPGAKRAYERVLNKCQASPWCKEAEWWAAQANWWLLMRKRMVEDSGGAGPATPAEK